MAGVRVDPDAAVVEVDDAFGDGKAEAGAALGAGGRAVGLLELLEDAILLFGWDARAGVLDFDEEGAVLGPV